MVTDAPRWCGFGGPDHGGCLMSPVSEGSLALKLLTIAGSRERRGSAMGAPPGWNGGERGVREAKECGSV